jgi:hypothetical protein
VDNRQKGNLATASAIHRFVSAGYTVSIPLTDTAKYDLVVERDGRFQAVQCKYAGYEGNQGLYSVPLYVSGETGAPGIAGSSTKYGTSICCMSSVPMVGSM